MLKKSLFMGVAAAALFMSLGMSSTLSSSAIAGDLKTDVQSDFKYLENLYHWFHTNAELSFQEKNTSARLAKELRVLNIDVTEGVGGYGVVGVIKNGPGLTLMIRADMDGLPIEELTGLPYASKNTGLSDDGKILPVMHGCGHDVHITSLVGTARQMMARLDEWSGTLVLIGQPAEERIGGARAMLADGLFERFPLPDYNLALHVEPGVAGTAKFMAGYSLANVDSVDILVRGISGHGSAPHVTKDPIVIASQIVMALQTIVSRELNPRETGVVTVGSFHGGLKHNIIGEEVKMQLTVRSYTDEARKILKDGIKRIAENMGRVAGLPDDLLPVVTFLENESTPSNYNDPEMVARVRATVGKELGIENIRQSEPSMAGEDFAYFGRTKHDIPSMTYGIGGIGDAQRARHAAAGTKVPGNHSSYFAPDADGTLQTGVRSLTAAALDILAKK
jgi:hippurate hydrolase